MVWFLMKFGLAWGERISWMLRGAARGLAAAD